MARALVALLLILGHLPIAAAARRRAVQHPSAPVAPAALVTAARQTAEAAMAAGVPAVQIAVSDGGEIIYSEAFGLTDRESAIAATPRSVLQTGSITKGSELSFIQNEALTPMDLPVTSGSCPNCSRTTLRGHIGTEAMLEESVLHTF